MWTRIRKESRRCHIFVCLNYIYLLSNYRNLFVSRLCKSGKQFLKLKIHRLVMFFGIWIHKPKTIPKTFYCKTFLRQLFFVNKGCVSNRWHKSTSLRVGRIFCYKIVFPRTHTEFSIFGVLAWVHTHCRLISLVFRDKRHYYQL